MTDQTTTHWVDEFLVPLDACERGIEKARKFSAPQEAWDAWDNGSELIWTLARYGEHDQRKLVLCACEIAESVLHVFEKSYPEDGRPRKAIESARAWAEIPTGENRRNADAAVDAACAARSACADCAADDAANAAYYAARSAFHAASHAADTASAAAHAACAAASAADGTERQAQADIVRKYFPVSPFVKGEPK